MINLDALREIRLRFAEITDQMAQPEVATNPEQTMTLGGEHTALRPVVTMIDTYEGALGEMDDLREMIALEDDDELVKMARTELGELEEHLPALEEELRYALIPKDPEDSKNAIVEVRAGTGGDEACLFAADLFRLYTRFAEQHGWTAEVMEATAGSQGGYREIIFSVSGQDAFGTMKYESGVHRVQRVPVTESSGRIHTSAATVAVLPEAAEVDVALNMNDLRIDVYRSSGPGGQSVNTTDSAVRITHIPTGLVVSIQDEKSQHKNKDKALRVLRARLYEQELAKHNAERDAARKSMVGSGDRSAKIRTYNYPQDRVTDHRLTGDTKNYPLHKVIDGNLGAVIKALRMEDNAERLAQLNG